MISEYRINNALESVLACLADEHADGHYSIMKYTHDWGVMLGTPDSWEIHLAIPKGATKTEALSKAVAYYVDDTEESMNLVSAMEDVLYDHISKGFEVPKGWRLLHLAKRKLEEDN